MPRPVAPADECYRKVVASIIIYYEKLEIDCMQGGSGMGGENRIRKVNSRQIVAASAVVLLKLAYG